MAGKVFPGSKSNAFATFVLLFPARAHKNRSMRKRTFFFLLLILLMAYGGARYWARNRPSLFETQLIAIDTNSITAISIIPERSPQNEITLKREGKSWIASQGNRTVRASFQALNPLLAKLADIESQRIVTKYLPEWNNYGVGPEQGARVRVFRNGEILEDFLIGRFDTSADSIGYTFIRLWEDEEVFAVRGNLGPLLCPAFDAFRSRALLGIDPSKVQEIWWEPVERDSAAVFSHTPQIDSFLQNVRSLQGESFADAFDPVRSAQLLQGRITFFGTDWETPVEVAWYRDSLEEKSFIFSSTSNPDNYFSSDSAGIFGQLVIPFYSFAAATDKEAATQ